PARYSHSGQQPAHPAPTPHVNGVPLNAEPSSFFRASAPPYQGGAPSRRTASWAGFQQFVSSTEYDLPRRAASISRSRQRKLGLPPNADVMNQRMPGTLPGGGDYFVTG